MNGKKKDRRILIRFILILVLAAAAGGAMGIGAMWLSSEVLTAQSDRLAALGRIAAQGLPAAAWIANLAVFTVALASYLRARRQAGAWDGTEESLIDQAEQRLNLPLILANALMVCNFIYFTLLTGCAGMLSRPAFFIGLAAFLFALAVCIVMTSLVVNLEKRLNPEKQGNVLDTRFQKEWLASCDEGEKAVIFQAAFQAYRFTCSACLVLWLACMLAQVMGLAGPLPGVCVTVLWLVLTMTYSLACVRLERRNHR